MLVNSANVLFKFFGMKIGSYPQPLPFCVLEILPSIFASKDLEFLSSQKEMIETNFAFLFCFKSCKIPLLPMVLKTYEEYGPGNPHSESMKSPSSSTIIGFLHF